MAAGTLLVFAPLAYGAPVARNADTLPGGRSTNHDEHDVRAALPRPPGARNMMRGKRSRGHAIMASAAL